MFARILSWWMYVLCIHTILFESFVCVFLELRLSVLVHHKQSHIMWRRPTDYGLVCSWRDFKLYLTFWGPCIVIYSYNRSKYDALFLNFILIYNSTCFGQTYCPSSGVLIQTVNINSMRNTNCCEYSIKTPDDGQYVCPKYVDLFTTIKLRNSASCWLILYEYIKMHGLQNSKFCDFYLYDRIATAGLFSPSKIVSQWSLALWVG